MRLVRRSEHIKKVCIENPVCIMSSLYRKPDQTIQPWQFGHGETKATCLWLKGLPLLQPSNVVDGRENRIWKMPPSPDRWKLRSVTYKGIAEAMAEQWGGRSPVLGDEPLPEHCGSAIYNSQQANYAMSKPTA